MTKYLSYLLFDLVAFTLLLHFPVSAQEFSSQLVFEDAAGSRDTVIIGYDEKSTFGVDPNLGEKNIIAEEFNSDFEVRITDELEMRACYPDSSGTYHLKKQIVPYSCAMESVISINIKCNNWPVKVFWDKEQFDTHCLEGSLLISTIYKGYYNIFGVDGLHAIRLTGNSTLSLELSELMWAPETYSFLNSNQEVIYGIWIALGNENLLSRAVYEDVKLFEFVENDEKDQILFFPFLNVPTYLGLYRLDGESITEKIITERSNAIFSLRSRGPYIMHYRNIFMEDIGNYFIGKTGP